MLIYYIFIFYIKCVCACVCRAQFPERQKSIDVSKNTCTIRGISKLLLRIVSALQS